ncbi:MAG: hypothetical protein NZL83_03400 [Candidatus Absconditabacterales bacterium]|nr:hypothetical protein [Candidatus Absconditabacterales bacterium]
MSITVFLAIGKGAEAEIRQYIDVLAAKKLDIGPDWGMGGEGSELRQSLRFDEDDIMFLRDHVPGIASLRRAQGTEFLGATVMIGQPLFCIGGILGSSRNPQSWD